MALETILVAFAAMLIGAVFCFGGYKWFMILLPVWGFMMGFSTGIYGVSSVYETSLLSLPFIFVAGVILGLLFAVISYLFFPAAIIILGASLGYSAVWTFTISLGLEPGLIPALFGLIAAIAAAVSTIHYGLPKYAIIVSTSALGSIAITMGIALLTGNVSLQETWQGLSRYLVEASTTWTILCIALAVAGLVVQLHLAKGYEMDYQST